MKRIICVVTAIMMTFIISSSSMANNINDKRNSVSNEVRHQQEVDSIVKAQKKHYKVILLVAFGSTWQQAFDSYDATIKAYKEAFPMYDVHLAFTSRICIKRAAAGQNTAKRNYYAPEYWLEAFGRVQYNEIIVQSLQIIPGEEYGRMVSTMKDFANNAKGALDDSYLNPENGRLVLRLGKPLLANATEDVNNLAKALHAEFGTLAAKGAVTLMGHGNANEDEAYHANMRYTLLEQALQQISKHYYVGTVDTPNNFKTNVLQRMKANGINGGTVYCIPLMSIAGNHTYIDMAGDDAEFNLNGENGEMENTSWKKFFAASNYTCNNETMVLKGLLDFENIRDLWIKHTQEAIVVNYHYADEPR